MSKKPPKGLGLHEPLRLQEHSRPSTRREFVAQGFMTGAATVLCTLPARHVAARAARANGWPPDINALLTACGIPPAPGKIPFICFDLSGGGNIAGSNVLVGGPKGPARFPLGGRLQQARPARHHGAESSAAGSFIDATFGCAITPTARTCAA